jgi:hypothetical protein
MFEKIVSPEDSNRLPGVFITGESITSTDNSMNIRQKFEIISGRAYWDKEK